MGSDPTASVIALRKIISELDAELFALVESHKTGDTDTDVLLNTFLEINLAKRDLSFVYGTIEARLIELMENDIVNLRDGAQIERKHSSNRTKWQHQELASAVADRVVQSSIDMSTGEILFSPKEIATKMLDFVQPSYWRATKLNEIGVNIDSYCESEYKTTLIVRKGDAS